MGLSSGRAGPWWEDPDFDWTTGNPGALFSLLATFYPDWSAIEAITRAANCGFQPEPTASATAAELWMQALRCGALKRRIPELMDAVLANQAKNEKQPLFKSLWANIFSSPGQPGEGPIGGLQAITSAGAGLGDAIACVQAMMNLIWRTAAIRVNGSENGTGFLVGDNLLLTAAHVVEGAKHGPGGHCPIAAVFDFDSRSVNSHAETGIVIPVDGVICDSPPTPGEWGGIPGEDWNASPENLDFALLQLTEPAPKVRAVDGTLTRRGCYVLDPDLYKFNLSPVLIIAQYPLRDFLKFSYITQQPEQNDQETRIGYLGNTLKGSSGGPVVDTRGNLVALHHYSNRKRNQGVPASAIARQLEDSRYAGLFETADAAHLGVYSADAREKVCRGIGRDCEFVAGALGITVPIHDANALWDWLANHRTLHKLRHALAALDREDLAHILDYDLIKVDRPTIDHISEQASQLVSSITPAKAARTATGLLASTVVARHRTSKLRMKLGSLPTLQKHPLLALQWRMNWSREFTRAETSLGNLARALPVDKSQARQALSSVNNMIRYAQDAESAAEALKELARSPALSF